MRLKNKIFNMYVADSFSKKAIGLMYREKIKDNEGMFFPFLFERPWKIWMLNMRFPIDVIWLDKNGRVVHIETNLKPCKGILSCPSYMPHKPAKYVIELNANMSKKLGIKLGDTLITSKT